MSSHEPFSTMINCNGRLVSLDTPRVMGILNVTPDSFYDGGKNEHWDNILKQVERFISEGASFIDIGAYSSRPGAEHISEEKELGRLKFLPELFKAFPELMVSIDTFRSRVARYAIEQGACMINDISGGQLDGNMFALLSELKVPYVCMHMKGNPQTMRDLTDYENLLDEMLLYFSERLNNLRSLGVNDIILDPGFGFAKNLPQNFEILRRLKELSVLNCPILIGLSRKSMINKVLNTKPIDALNGTTALNMLALNNGASILRVHDVNEAVEAVRLFQAYRGDLANIAT